MYPKRTDTLSKVASSGRSSALHTFFDVGDPRARARRAAMSSISGTRSSARRALRHRFRDAQTRLTRARGNVEMLMIGSDVETLDHRADRTN